MSTAPSPQISQDLPLARQYAKQGRLVDAEAAFRRVLQSNPNLPEALRFVANAALAHGDPSEAVNLLNHAVDADRGDPSLLLDLGVAYRAGQRYDAAAYVLNRAIEAGNRSIACVARLLLGSVLEADQRPDQAVLNYFRAVLEAQAAGLWLNDATTDPSLRGIVRHAMGFIGDARRREFERCLEPVRRRAQPHQLDRADQALAVYLREQATSPDQSAQRPTFVNIPGLPVERFVDVTGLEWCDQCVRAVAALADEMDDCTTAAQSPAPGAAFTLDSLLGHADAPDNASRPPTSLPIFQRGELREPARSRAIRLQAALELAPVVRIPGSGPDATIVSLSAGQREGTRFGRSNSRLVAVIVPSTSSSLEVTVGTETRLVAPGELVAFDPTFGYEYAGVGQARALALAFEFWHPGLTPIEREAITAITSEAVAFDQKLQDLG